MCSRDGETICENTHFLLFLMYTLLNHALKEIQNHLVHTGITLGRDFAIFSHFFRQHRIFSAQPR